MEQTEATEKIREMLERYAVQGTEQTVTAVMLMEMARWAVKNSLSETRSEDKDLNNMYYLDKGFNLCIYQTMLNAKKVGITLE